MTDSWSQCFLKVSSNHTRTEQSLEEGEGGADRANTYIENRTEADSTEKCDHWVYDHTYYNPSLVEEVGMLTSILASKMAAKFTFSPDVIK